MSTLPLSLPRTLLGATLFALVLALCATPAAARGVYQEPDDFIDEVFGRDQAETKLIWLSKELQPSINKILGHDYPSLRLRYWRQGERTAWVVEETGKEKPITLGIVIHGDRIERLRVLTFREGRGDEIRHPFFTSQFSQLSLQHDLQLSDRINGVSGATLSVRAAEKLARLALYLHKQVVVAP